MAKITIDEGKFTCPLLNKEIDLSDHTTSINVTTCSKCKYNIFKQIVEDAIYCDYA